MAAPRRGAYIGDLPQGIHVADLGAATASAPAAMTQAAITGGEPPTEAEFNALRADVAALRGTVAALVTDAAADRAKINAVLDALRDAGLLATE